MAKIKKLRISPFLKRHFPRVERVIDAKKGVRVTVKPRDCGIDAKRKDPTSCALAKATRRQYKADGVIIGLTASYVIRGKRAVRFSTPISVQRELVSFDRHHDFAPGKYKLAPVSPSQTEEGRAEKKKREHGSGIKSTHPRRIVHKMTARVRTLR